VSTLGSPLRGISADQLRAVVSNAFEQWTSVDCGGHSHPSFQVDVFPDVSCTDVKGENEYKTSGPNYNLWMFQDDGWDFTDTDAESTIAITHVLFDQKTGEIFNADVFFNSYVWDFTLEPNSAGYDLPSVVQHESGHFLGLAHSQVRTATMWPRSDVSDTSLRSLDPDDVNGICSVYPPGHIDPTCDPEPRHGFSTTCELTKTGCTLAPARVPLRSDAWLGSLLGLFLVFIRSRRRAPKA
jgi:hypothetical protein